MASRPTISAIIITKDEEQNIRECLESVSWMDEIVVLDSGSSDRTVEIAKEFTPEVFVTDWPGYGAQKNRALDKAKYEWIFSLDADERVTPELRQEIESAISSTEHAGYRMPRLSSYCGRFMKHGGWWPDHVIRLAKRGSCKFSDSLVHESMIVDGTLGTLSNPIIHYTYRTMDDVTMMIHRYSSASAKMMFEKGKSSSVSKAIGRSILTFIRTYLLKLGFLDGKEGFMLAISNSQLAFYKYLKLYFLNKCSGK
jgi:glycosyltransferase involved in cell wall biosynthesis